MQIEALKEARGLKEMYGEEYHFRSDHVDETTPHLRVILLPLTKRKIYRRKKDVIGDKKKMRRTQEIS